MISPVIEKEESQADVVESSPYSVASSKISSQKQPEVKSA